MRDLIMSVRAYQTAVASFTVSRSRRSVIPTEDDVLRIAFTVNKEERSIFMLNNRSYIWDWYVSSASLLASILFVTIMTTISALLAVAERSNSRAPSLRSTGTPLMVLM